MSNSSYAKNNYGKIFKEIVKSNSAHNIVELGVLYGYSTIHLARGLVHNKAVSGVIGHLNSYDLWESYPYKHTAMLKTQDIINENNLQDFITLHKGDAFDVYKKYDDESICLLHVDISNTGETLKKVMSLWNSKIRCNGIILFEGGSIERDNVDWMIKYKEPLIRDEIYSNKIINEFYSVNIYEKFPSLTAFCKNKTAKKDNMRHLNQINNNTKKAWEKNWQPHEIDSVMQIFNYPRVRKQVKLFEKYLPKDEKILEGGCGLGPYLLYFSKKGYEIIGIDYNQEPLDKIKKYDNTVNVKMMDVRSLKFPDEFFGGYLSLGVIEHFPEGPQKAIEEANRVLKKGGIFIVQVPIMNMFLMLKYPWELFKRNKFIRRILKKSQKDYYWQQYFKAGRLKYILEKRGFKVLEIRPMDHEHNIISTFGFLRDKSSYDGASNAGIKMSEFCEKHLRWPTAANMVLICKKEK